jgi:DNA mismatch repair protein MutS2
MSSQLTPGDAVQTPFGKGVVREIGNGNRVTVDVHGRAFVFTEGEVSAAPDRKRSRGGTSAAERQPERTRAVRQARTGLREVDLHGLTVQEALDRMEQALSEALLADVSELRLIHGRSGGRIRAAVHRRLREIPGARKFRLDPQNEGVTIVTL